MVDGAALLAAMIHGFRAGGSWGERGTNLLDTGSWYYDVYETADGGYISVGPVEQQFYDELLRIIGLSGDGRGPVPDRDDQSTWPAMKERMTALVKTKTRSEWCDLLEGSDACFAPVLGPAEAPRHPHNQQRGTFTEVAGVVQPAPAPRFSRTAVEIAGPPVRAGQDTDSALGDWGFSKGEIAELKAAGAVRSASPG
jgi:alpha-methylacyl-CoA racemase